MCQDVFHGPEWFIVVGAPCHPEKNVCSTVVRGSGLHRRIRPSGWCHRAQLLDLPIPDRGCCSLQLSQEGRPLPSCLAIHFHLTQCDPLL